MQRRRSRVILLIIPEKFGQGYSAWRGGQSLVSLEVQPARLTARLRFLLSNICDKDDIEFHTLLGL
jgi:hypothetical protein